VVLSGTAFAVQSVLAKAAYHRGADVPQVLATRFVVASVVAWAMLGWLSRRRATRSLRLPRRQLLGLAGLGALFVTSALFGYLALERLPVGTTSLLIFLYPALVAIWAHWLFGDRLTRSRAVALGLALLGCALIVDPVAVLDARSGLSLAGVGLALGSALSNSWYATLSAPLSRGIPGLTATAYSLPVTAVCFVVYLIVQGDGLRGVSPTGWVLCVLLGVVAGGAIFTFLAGVARIGASHAAVAATSEPAATVALGILLLGEPLSLLTFAGACSILTAIFILARGMAPAPRRDVAPR